MIAKRVGKQSIEVFVLLFHRLEQHEFIVTRKVYETSRMTHAFRNLSDSLNIILIDQ